MTQYIWHYQLFLWQKLTARMYKQNIIKIFVRKLHEIIYFTSFTLKCLQEDLNIYNNYFSSYILPYLCMYRPQPNFQTEITEKIIFLEYYCRSRNYEYNFFEMKCEVISNISRTPFSPLNFRQKMCGLYLLAYLRS
jgi:hypothetical protein